ncbi:MAG: hypothetical protein C4530_23350, partial [Desulfobacteraceae bacterium]
MPSARSDSAKASFGNSFGSINVVTRTRLFVRNPLHTACTVISRMANRSVTQDPWLQGTLKRTSLEDFNLVPDGVDDEDYNLETG